MLVCDDCRWMWDCHDQRWSTARDVEEWTGEQVVIEALRCWLGMGTSKEAGVMKSISRFGRSCKCKNKRHATKMGPDALLQQRNSFLKTCQPTGTVEGGLYNEVYLGLNDLEPLPPPPRPIITSIVNLGSRRDDARTTLAPCHRMLTGPSIRTRECWSPECS